MVARTRLTCTEDHFRLIAEPDAYEGDRRIFSSNRDRRISGDAFSRHRRGGESRSWSSSGGSSC